MSGFEKQTYTQTPNSLFEVMKDMDECELKVVLCICRLTFGYHRDEIEISTRKIAKKIGMSTASVAKGAESAVARGLIEKVSSGQKTTVWRAIVSGSENESPDESDSENDTEVVQKVNQSDSNNEPQLGIKERKKDKEVSTSEKPEIDKVAEWLRMSQFPGAKKALRVDSILSYCGAALRRTTTSREWEDFAKWVDERQQKHGENVEGFVKWLLTQKNYDPQFWPVKKMQEFWPSAFPVIVPGKSDVEETRKKIESEDWRKRA